MSSSLHPSRSPALAETLSVLDSALASLGRRIPAHISREDLASAGKLALIKALLRFKGSPAEAQAYCYVRVRGALLDELRRIDPLSRYTRARVRQVQDAALTLQRQLGRPATRAELAAATGFSSATLAALQQLAESDRSPVGGEGADDLLNGLSDGNAPCPARAAESGDIAALLHAAVERLGPKQALVLRRYHLEEATLEEIARELRVSRERVRQIRESAEKQLREDLVVLALWQSVFTRGQAPGGPRG